MGQWFHSYNACIAPPQRLLWGNGLICSSFLLWKININLFIINGILVRLIQDFDVLLSGREFKFYEKNVTRNFILRH